MVLIASLGALAVIQNIIAAVYTPKDFELNRIMSDLVRIVEDKADAAE